MKKIIIFFVFLISFITAQSNNNEIIKNSIRDVMKTSQDGWNEGNWEKYMSCYWQSDSTSFVSGGNVTYGYKTIKERFQKSYSDKAKMGILTFSDLEIKVLNNEYALVIGKWHLQRENDAPWGRYSLLFQYIDSKWLVINDHSSSAN